MSTALRTGIALLAMAVTRNFIASHQGKEFLAGREQIRYDSIIWQIEQSRRAEDCLGDLSSCDTQNVVEIVRHQAMSLKMACLHAPSFDVLCQHFAAMAAERAAAPEPVLSEA